MLSTQILKLDPLVSDTACQTRACYLIYLSRKIKTTDLSAEETNYLEACDLLTQTQSRKTDIFGLITEEKTDIDKIPATILPPTTSKTKKNTLLAKRKSEVATATLKFLQQGCNQLALLGDPEIFTYRITSFSQHIPVFPFYISAKMMLHYAAMQSIPLVVNLRRLSLQDHSYVLDGAVSLVYGFKAEAGRFIPQEAKENAEVIAIDAVSCYVKGKEDEVQGFLASPTFEAFLEAFQKEDIAALVMLCALGHPPYPPSAKPPKLTKETLPAEEAKQTMELKKEGIPLKVSLEKCSQQEIALLAAYGRHYGFFRPNVQYASLEPKTQKLTRASTCLPFFIDHVRAATAGECKATMAGLMEKQKQLKVAQEEIVQPSMKIGMTS